MASDFEDFYDAATMGDRNAVVAMLAMNPKLVGACDANGFTALHGLAGQDEPELAAFLIDGGADVSARTTWE
jgi:ankyrin repeat protein